MQRKHKIDCKAVKVFCDAALRYLDRPDCALSVVFVANRKMRSLNRVYRGKDYVTDVLSFSYGKVEIEGIPFLGEIVIAPQVAIQQAFDFRVLPERELRKLLLHGILHLLGYDHETDQGRMVRFQAALIRREFFIGGAALIDLKRNP